MSTAAEPFLLADIGGTNARFALFDGVTTGAVQVLATAQTGTLESALDEALRRLGADRVRGIAACAAGPPRDGEIRLTNCDWVVSEATLSRCCDGGAVVLVNDFTALAAALPALGTTDLLALGGDGAPCGSTRAVLGPGTGLGVSAALSANGREVHVTGEGGHVTLAPTRVSEAAILARLAERFGHVSAERVLSGSGLVNLHLAMHPACGLDESSDGATISARARDGDPQARATVAQFCRFLGAVAGDVALTFGAQAGVYIAGGIVPAWGALFDARGFRSGFESKGRYREYLSAIPTWVITAPHPALRGLARLLAQRRHAS